MIDREGQFPRSIETHGSHSPGNVSGNYTINTKIIHEAAIAKRKVWRDIEVLSFLWPGTLVGACDMLLLSIAMAAEELKGFHRFTTIFSCKSAQPVLFQMIGNQPQLFQRIRSFVASWAKDQSRINDSNNAEETRAQIIQSRMTEIEALRDRWMIRLVAPGLFDGRVHAVEVEIDSTSRRLDISLRPSHSTNPATYPEHLRTTSEFLHFLTALIRSQPFTIIDNFEIFFRSYSLQKFWCHFSDSGMQIDFSRLRFNDRDFEEWDYLYPEFDNEVEIRRGR